MSGWKLCFSLLTLLTSIHLIHSQTFQSLMILQDMETDFIPANPVELIASYTNVATLMSCFSKCNMNPLCRTFVSDTVWPFNCRLYEGSIDTGTIIIASSPTSRVSSVHYDVSLYETYNQVCDPNRPPFDRYLICENQLWNCPTGTYWNGLMCINQVYYQASCDGDKVCREDIGLTCSSSCQKCSCNSASIWNGTLCVSSNCPNVLPTDSSLVALWSFDGDTDDLMNNYNGTILGSLSYIIGYIGQALNFSNDGYVVSSYIDFYRRSFTIEMWFYPTNITGTRLALFSECSVGIDNQCLHIGTNEYDSVGMGFWNDDFGGSTILTANQWYHVAFVYDDDRRQELIYINGLSNTIAMSKPGASHLYLGQSGNAAIGGTPISSNDFIGYIDHVSVTHRVKTAAEILDDASLVAYYSFDCGSTLDSGPNLLHGSGNGYIMITGRRNGAIEFNSSSAYFQASGFTALGTSNQSFSISLWIKPLNLSGILVRITNTSAGEDWCTTLLGFNKLGNITARLPGTEVYGPVPAVNVWIHIIYTFSVIDGVRLYINGSLYALGGGNITREVPNMPLYLLISKQLSIDSNCSSGNISNIQYMGAVDELRIYNREITASEACILSS